MDGAGLLFKEGGTIDAPDKPKRSQFLFWHFLALQRQKFITFLTKMPKIVFQVNL